MVRGANSIGSMESLCVLCHVAPFFMVSSVNIEHLRRDMGYFNPDSFEASQVILSGRP